MSTCFTAKNLSAPTAVAPEAASAVSSRIIPCRFRFVRQWHWHCTLRPRCQGLICPFSDCVWLKTKPGVLFEVVFWLCKQMRTFWSIKKINGKLQKLLHILDLSSIKIHSSLFQKSDERNFKIKCDIIFWWNLEPQHESSFCICLLVSLVFQKFQKFATKSCIQECDGKKTSHWN